MLRVPAIAVASVMVTVATVAFWHGSSHNAPPTSAPETDLGNLGILSNTCAMLAKPKWMAQLSDSTEIASVSMPGTHDTMTYQINTGKIKGFLPCNLVGGFVQCQSCSLADQFEAGIRFVDIRLRAQDGRLDCQHDMCYLDSNFGTVLSDAQKFLAQNPTEFLLMRIRDEYAGNGNVEDVLLKTYLSNPAWNALFKRNCNGACTVGQLRGHILPMRDYGNGQSSFGISWGDVQKQDDYTVTSPAAKWAAVKAAIPQAEKTLPGTFFISFASAQPDDADAQTGNLKAIGNFLKCTQGAIKCIADYVNPRLASTLAGIHNKYVGVIAMDFPTSADVANIIQTNFGPECGGNWCQSHGYLPDECNCGVCGSYGGCSWSCNAAHSNKKRQLAACPAQGARVAPRAEGRCIGGNALSSACSKFTTQTQCTTKKSWWSLGMGTCRWEYLGKTVAGTCQGNTVFDGSCSSVKSSSKCLAKKNWFGVVMCHWK